MVADISKNHEGNNFYGRNNTDAQKAHTGFLIAYKKRSRLFVGLAISILVVSYFVEALLNLWFKYKYRAG